MRNIARIVVHPVHRLLLEVDIGVEIRPVHSFLN